MADTKSAGTDHLVLTMDYGHDLELPSVPDTSRQWGVLECASVRLFGIHCAPHNQQTNYVYSEAMGGKGSNEVISMLQQFLQERAVPWKDKLSIFSDKCCAHDTIDLVLKFLVALTHTQRFAEIHYNVTARGHVSHAYDRDFNVVRKALRRRECWTLTQVVQVVRAATTSSTVVCLENRDSAFVDHQSALHKAYKSLKDLDKYQLFTTRSCIPGAIECRRFPTDAPVTVDLRERLDGTIVSAAHVQHLLDRSMPLHIPGISSEKAATLFARIRPYVPAEHQGDLIYQAPRARPLARASDPGHDCAAVKKRKAVVLDE